VGSAPPTGTDLRGEYMSDFPLPSFSTIADSLLAAMRATGKPRGLTWECVEVVVRDGRPDVLFATEQATGAAIALVLVTVRFAAIPGGEMEDVAAVPEIRTGTAVLRRTEGQWQPSGRILFNLLPGEAIRHLGEIVSQRARE
jgi:hypothetical protein